MSKLMEADPHPVRQTLPKAAHRMQPDTDLSTQFSIIFPSFALSSLPPF